MAQAIDPVCKMTVDTATARHTSQYQDTTYYFCAPGCKKAFDKEPEKYLAGHDQDNGHSGHTH
jgi:YHS domain-containing protein